MSLDHISVGRVQRRCQRGALRPQKTYNQLLISTQTDRRNNNNNTVPLLTSDNNQTYKHLLNGLQKTAEKIELLK